MRFEFVDPVRVADARSRDRRLPGAKFEGGHRRTPSNHGSGEAARISASTATQAVRIARSIAIAVALSTLGSILTAPAKADPPTHTFAEGQMNPITIGNAAAGGVLLLCEPGQFIQNTAGVYSCVNAATTRQEPSDTVEFIPNMPNAGSTQIRFCSEIDPVKEPNRSNDVVQNCAVKAANGIDFNLKLSTGSFALSEPSGLERMTEKIEYNPTVAGQPGYGMQGSSLLTYVLISDTPAPLPEKKNEGKSSGRSVSYDASQQVLSFANDHMTDTGFAGDPIIGASISVPNSRLVGPLLDGSTLFSTDPGAEDFSISSGPNIYLQAQLPVVSYLPDENLYVGALANPVFASLGSPWIAEMQSIFDPSSPDFDPNSLLWFSYSPDSDMLILTTGFSTSGTSGGTNGIFADAVPEPPTIWLMAAAILGALMRWRRR